MEDEELDRLFDHPEEFVPYDNVMLNMPDASAAPAQPARRGREPAPPPEYIDPREAVASLRGLPAPPPDDEFVDYDTSCDELEEEYDQCAPAIGDGGGGSADGCAPPNPRRPPNPPNGVDDDALLDDAFSSATARAERSSQGIDQLLADEQRPRRGGGGGGGGGSNAPSSSIRDLYSAPRTQCFGCLWTSRNRVKVDKHLSADKINQLNQIWSDLFGRSSNWTIAKLIHLYFKHEIYNQLASRRHAALRRGDVEHAPPMVKMWRTKEILIHFTRHQLDPRIHVKTAIERFRNISEMLYMSSCTKTPGGSGVAPDEKNIALMLRVEAQLMRMYAQPMSNLNFHNDELNIDFHTMGALMGPYRNFSIEPA